MINARPTPSQERWLLLAARYSNYAQAEAVVAGIQGWRSVSFLTRCAFIVLGLIAAAAASGLCALMFEKHFAIPAGALLIIASELLIRDRRLFASGIEEAILATGYMLTACGLLFAIGGYNNDTHLLWVIVLALLFTGLRLLNPLFTTLAIITCSIAVSVSLGRRFIFSSGDYAFANLGSSVFCYAIAVIALVLGAKRFQRPSYDRMLDWLVIVMPAAGYIWSVERTLFEGYSMQRLWQIYVLATPLTFAIAAFIIAIRRRKHAPFFTTMGCLACVAYELRHLTGMPLYGRLIVWGTVMLIVATIAERWLRTPRKGISSLNLENNGNSDNVLSVAEMAGTALVTPATRSSVPDPPPTMEGGGGNFGGGGASGKF